MAFAEKGRRSSPDRGGEEQPDPPANPESVARLICLRLLDQRARTRFELADAMRRRDVPQSAADSVLDRFTELGLVDDMTLANEFVLARHRNRAQTGPALAAALRRRGVDERVVRDALAQIDPEDDAAAARALARTRLARMVDVDDFSAMRRLIGLLARRGHSSATAMAAARQVIAERADGANLDHVDRYLDDGDG